MTAPQARTQQFESHTVVVTGANGAIGAAAVEAFVNQGASVFAVDRDTPREANNGRDSVTSIQIDITDIDAVAALAGEIVAQTGRLDCWVNNAGMLRRSPAIDITAEAWDLTMGVNLRGAFFAAQAAARVMIKIGQGTIINVSSYAGLKGRPNCADYAVSKAGISHLTSCLAVEWGPLGLRVNAIAPGYIETPMSSWMRSSSEVYDEYMSRTPSRRLGTPEEIASAMVYLASDASSYVNGHTLVVDGGISLA
ncbi:SDR family NAD(P)-dependent oxidoreductase [Paenarthrobacter sp. 2TAF44]|uniref:SDR family NAD(P)-dependent oxidoreductase n=1 Tax=Paenarthrobacter sp. 2TAF44 TaxID=3233018 RepID=UPI003F975FE7